MAGAASAKFTANLAFRVLYVAPLLGTPPASANEQSERVSRCKRVATHIVVGGIAAAAKSDWVTFDDAVSKEQRLLLADAQTSGGLLACVPSAIATRVTDDLRRAGVAVQSIIGRIEGAGDGRIFVSAGSIPA